jgi:hypothetical protein
MKKSLALLIATTGLTAVLAMPAWSAVQASLDFAAKAAELTSQVLQDTSNLIYVSDNDDDDDDNGRRRSKHDDDDDGDDCDDDKKCSGAANPTPAGQVTPPKNGLFGDGKAPKVDVN